MESETNVREEQKAPTFTLYFEALPDPRVEGRCWHLLMDILVIALCAMLSGAESFTEMEAFGDAKEDWLKERLSLPNGIPRHDTFARVFQALDPVAFERCLIAWTRALAEHLPGQVVALDGKTIRGSFNAATGRCLHLLSAFATENRLVLGQVAVEGHENEIVALPHLLDLLDLAGCIVTIDAMGCQKEVARQVTEKKADYVLTVKDNHPDLLEDLVTLFEEVGSKTFSLHWPHSFFESWDYDHGRKERRRCYAIGEVDWLQERCGTPWAGLRSVAMVESTRITRDRKTGKNKTSVERRYLISSLSADAEKLLSATRSHWGIENTLHWSLDVGMGEDLCRVRKDNAPRNLATLRKIALHLVKQDTTKKLGVKAKRHLAAWKTEFLEHLLTRY